EAQRWQATGACINRSLWNANATLEVINSKTEYLPSFTARNCSRIRSARDNERNPASNIGVIVKSDSHRSEPEIRVSRLRQGFRDKGEKEWLIKSSPNFPVLWKKGTRGRKTIREQETLP